MKGSAKSKAVHVHVLYTEGCANTPATIELIREVAETIGIQIQISKRLIETARQAEEMRFLGSPTVLVDDLDMDPAVRESVSYGFM